MLIGRWLLAIEISSVCLALFLSAITFADYDMYGVVATVECVLFVVGLISGALAWMSLHKMTRFTCAIFLLIPGLLLPQLLWWSWDNAVHPPHLKEEASLDNVAFAALQKDDFKTAEESYKSILQKERSGYFRGHNQVELALAVSLEGQGKVAEAEQVYLAAIARYVGDKESYEPKDPGDIQVTCIQNLADFYLNQKRYSDAEPLFKRALMMHTKNKWLSYEYVKCNEEYARLLRAKERTDKAKPFEQEAQRIRKLNGWKPDD